MCRNYLPHKMLNDSAPENNVTNFQQYFETEFLISPKLNEKLYPSHVFLGIDYKTCLI